MELYECPIYKTLADVSKFKSLLIGCTVRQLVLRRPGFSGETARSKLACGGLMLMIECEFSLAE